MSRRRATTDLDAVCAGGRATTDRFLAPKDPDAARWAISGIRQGVKILARHARAGHPVEDMVVAFREWPIDFGSSGYVVLYRIDGDRVSLLAIRYQREAGY